MKLNQFATNPLHSMQTCQNKTEIQTVLADNLLILAKIAICGKTQEKENRMFNISIAADSCQLTCFVALKRVDIL
jgi:hypothetical protein